MLDFMTKKARFVATLKSFRRTIRDVCLGDIFFNRLVPD